MPKSMYNDKITSVISCKFGLIQPRRIDGSRRLQPLDGSRLDDLSPEAPAKKCFISEMFKKRNERRADASHSKPLKLNGKRSPRSNKQHPAQIPYARDRPVRRSRPTYPRVHHICNTTPHRRGSLRLSLPQLALTPPFPNYPL